MKRMKHWSPPDHWLKINTIDVHTEGKPLRVITSGFPDLQGETILARRRYTKENLDHMRTALVWEPRGHADMYGCILTPPVTPTFGEWIHPPLKNFSFLIFSLFR